MLWTLSVRSQGWARVSQNLCQSTYLQNGYRDIKMKLRSREFSRETKGAREGQSFCLGCFEYRNTVGGVTATIPNVLRRYLVCR